MKERSIFSPCLGLHSVPLQLSFSSHHRVQPTASRASPPQGGPGFAPANTIILLAASMYLPEYHLPRSLTVKCDWGGWLAGCTGTRMRHQHATPSRIQAVRQIPNLRKPLTLQTVRQHPSTDPSLLKAWGIACLAVCLRFIRSLSYPTYRRVTPSASR